MASALAFSTVLSVFSSFVIIILRREVMVTLNQI